MKIEFQGRRTGDGPHTLRKTRGSARSALRHHPRRRRLDGCRRARQDRSDRRSSTLPSAKCCKPASGRIPARQVLFKSGLAKTVTADTVNKVCASGLLAVVNAMRSINAGANSVVAAGGMESMSNAPYLLRDARWGYRFGDGKLVDAMIYDGLWDQYFPMTMATQGSKVAIELELTREEQDRFAYESHRRAAQAHAAGHFDEEIVPVNVASKAKDKVVVERLPRQGKVRVPAAVGAASEVWEHEPSAEFTLDYASYAPFLTGEHPHARRRSRRSRPHRRERRGDGEAEAAREERHRDGGQRAGCQRRRGGDDPRRCALRARARLRSAGDDRRARDGRLGLAVHQPHARDGGAETARSRRTDAKRHRTFGRSTKPSPPSRSPRPGVSGSRRPHQSIRRRRRDGPSDRRLGCTHRHHRSSTNCASAAAVMESRRFARAAVRATLYSSRLMFVHTTVSGLEP